MSEYIQTWIFEFKYMILGLVFVVAWLLLFWVMAIIKYVLITPIVNLTDHMQHTEKNLDKRKKYQDRIKKKLKKE